MKKTPANVAACRTLREVNLRICTKDKLRRIVSNKTKRCTFFLRQPQILFGHSIMHAFCLRGAGRVSDYFAAVLHIAVRVALQEPLR